MEISFYVTCGAAFLVSVVEWMSSDSAAESESLEQFDILYEPVLIPLLISCFSCEFHSRLLDDLLHFERDQCQVKDREVAGSTNLKSD